MDEEAAVPAVDRGRSPVAVELVDVCKRYREHLALDGLTLTLVRGEIYGLLGPNGAGKTTALRILCGLIESDSGTGHCLGAPLGSVPAGLGYVPQRGGLYDDLTVRENLLFFARAHGLAAPRRVVDETLAGHGLGERAAQFVRGLSGGWRQRVALAAALMHEPRLVLLDEPSAGLDPQAREALWLRLRSLTDDGVTLLVTTHYADEAERCDRLGYLDGGRLRVEGSPNAIIANAGLCVQHVTSADGMPAEQAETSLALADSTGWRVLRRCTNDDQRSDKNGADVRLADVLAWLAAGRDAARSDRP